MPTCEQSPCLAVLSSPSSPTLASGRESLWLSSFFRLCTCFLIFHIGLAFLLLIVSFCCFSMDIAKHHKSVYAVCIIALIVQVWSLSFSSSTIHQLGELIMPCSFCRPQCPSGTRSRSQLVRAPLFPATLTQSCTQNFVLPSLHQVDARLGSMRSSRWIVLFSQGRRLDLLRHLRLPLDQSSHRQRRSCYFGWRSLRWLVLVSPVSSLLPSPSFSFRLF